MHAYGIKDVEKLLHLPRATIRALVHAGFVRPARGARNAWRFSFQDLIVLRAAQSLVAARIPHRRITRSIRELRRHLPESMPLSGLSLAAVGDRVVIREGAKRWQADSGQYLLAFEGDPADGSLSVIERAPVPEAPAPQDWFHRAVGLERDDRDAALDAYACALAADPVRLDAHINRGRLLHEMGRLAEAERAYRAALEACGADAVLYFNLAVVLEDRHRDADARAAYEAALRADPDLADGHYNLALLYRKLGQPKQALRHMSQYRRLTSRKV